MKTVSLNRELIHTGNLILVNAKYPHKILQDKSNLKLSYFRTSNVLLNFHAVSLLSKAITEIKAEKKISIVSGWRSTEEQQEIYDKTLKSNGVEFTKKYVALPGHSEHETGLAVDLGLTEKNIDFVRPNFPCNGISNIFRKKSVCLGFIERYQKGKEKITGIAHEPWHFRYVGAPFAEIMNNHNLSLEEFIEFIKLYPYGKKSYKFFAKHSTIKISYLKAEKLGRTNFQIEDNVPFTVSGNNIDGFTVAEWR